MSDQIFDLQAIRDELDSAAWEPSIDDPDREERRCYLGSVFSLTPSGKYYLPFACSNVAPCERCKGNGMFPAHRKARIVKKWRARNDKRARKITRMRAQGVPEDTVRAYYTRTHHKLLTRECVYCGGLGSREAYLDQIWNEQAEKEIESIGCTLMPGEGDPCDLFAVESREASDENEARHV